MPTVSVGAFKELYKFRVKYRDVELVRVLIELNTETANELARNMVCIAFTAWMYAHVPRKSFMKEKMPDPVCLSQWAAFDRNHSNTTKHPSSQS